MKKILFILVFSMFMCSTQCFGETQWYKTTAFAFAKVYNGRYTWGDWEDSSISIAINLDNDVITVYSPTTQVYKVVDSYNNGNTYTDTNGGRNVKFYVIDQDYDRGCIRLRVEKNGTSQIYIDFNDCAWVYNVVRTR